MGRGQGFSFAGRESPGVAGATVTRAYIQKTRRQAYTLRVGTGSRWKQDAQPWDSVKGNTPV